MRKPIISSVILLSFIICASAQVSVDSQKIAPAKTGQSVDKNALNKKTIVNPKAATNWSKIKDLFR
jgi:hypothetical protein